MLTSSGKGEDEESHLFLKSFGWVNYIIMIIYFEQVQVKTIK